MFYGDSMITPAISVLSAVEGLRDRHARVQPVRDPDHAGHPHGPLRDPAPRHRAHGRALRSGHHAVVHRHRRLGRCPHREEPLGAGGAEPGARRDLLRALPVAGLLRAGRSLPGAHRRRGALRGHGPLRQEADPHRVVRAGDAGAAHQLLRPGRLRARQSGGHQEPVLPDASTVGADADGGAGHLCHGDRLAGGDLGRLLRHAPGDPAGLRAAPADLPHVVEGDRPDLRAVHQLVALRRGRAPGAGLPELGQPRQRLRARGGRDDGDRVPAGLGGGKAHLEVAQWMVGPRDRQHARDRRRLPRLQCHEDRQRRLVPAGDRRR